MLWNRKTDEFTLGQWLKGRIYERRSDLSPDGKHLIYFAMNGKWDAETKGSWTAVSLAPYLRAQTLYGKGDCWNGGGLFIDNFQFWLNDGALPHKPLQEASMVRRSRTSAPYQDYHGECCGIYYQRLQRDGWRLASKMKLAGDDDSTLFEKLSVSGWMLRKVAHAQINRVAGRGCYWDSHELIHIESGTSIDGSKWECADFDQDRVIWAEGGKLHAAKLGKPEAFQERTLHDFNDMMFEAIKAPY